MKNLILKKSTEAVYLFRNKHPGSFLVLGVPLTSLSTVFRVTSCHVFWKICGFTNLEATLDNKPRKACIGPVTPPKIAKSFRNLRGVLCQKVV